MSAKAPSARQVRRLGRARQRWQQRAVAKQREIRKLRVSVRDLKASRDLWKQRYQALQQQRATPPETAPLRLPCPVASEVSLPGGA